MMGHLLRKTKIRTRLTASLIAMCLVPVLILSVLLYRSYQETLYNKLSASTRQGLILYTTILDFHMSKCENISDGIMMDDIVQAALESRDVDDMSVAPVLGEAAVKYFNSLFMWESYMKGFTICGVNGNPLAEMGFVKIARSKLDALFSDFEAMEAYKLWLFTLDENQAPNIILCRKIFSTQTLGKLIGYALIYVDPEQLVDAANMGAAGVDNVQKIIVETPNDQIILYDGKFSGLSMQDVIPGYNTGEGSQRPYMEAIVAGTDSIVIMQEQTKTGWHILGILPKAELTAEMQQIFAPFAVAIAFILLLGVVFSTAIQRSIQKPIERIVDFTKDVALGDFSQLLYDDSNDEIGFLSQNIDSMVTQISGLFEQNKTIERKRHKLELEILQYQINPHFLFNTLNSFQYIAELNGVRSISQGIANLCTVLKYTLYETASPTLRQEIGIVEAYLNIQRLKFAGMFTAFYDLDPVSMDAQVIRFLLQPIVENSILHGIGESELHIYIRSVVEAGRLRIVVSDDGKGFDESSAVPGRNKFSGIGLRNVRERLNMRFGDDCSFLLESSLGNGTSTTIELPFAAVPESEDYNVESADRR